MVVEVRLGKYSTKTDSIYDIITWAQRSNRLIGIKIQLIFLFKLKVMNSNHEECDR